MKVGQTARKESMQRNEILRARENIKELFPD